jgi:hypothetical protein
MTFNNIRDFLIEAFYQMTVQLKSYHKWLLAKVEQQEGTHLLLCCVLLPICIPLVLFWPMWLHHAWLVCGTLARRGWLPINFSKISKERMITILIAVNLVMILLILLVYKIYE